MEKKDVLIVGGGAAGLSAALTLTRARRSVVVVDGGEPRNSPAAAAHGLLGLEGVNPLEFLSRGRSEVEHYGGKIIPAQVAGAKKTSDGVHLTLDTGQELLGRVLVVATGVRDELPAIPGLREQWGQGVVHCPYCHGWEIRDQRIGVLASGLRSTMQTTMFHHWSKQVQLFMQDLEFPEEELHKLAALGIPVVPGKVTRLETEGDRLSGVRLHDGSIVELDALAVHSHVSARLEGLTELGLETDENPMGTFVVTDQAGRTSVPDVWAAGNVADASMQVSEAAAQGARVAMTINAELIFQDTEQTVADRGSTRTSTGKEPQ